MHLHEEAREAGWSDEQILEAIAYVALERFTAMVNVAGDVPVDGSVEDTRTLRAAVVDRSSHGRRRGGPAVVGRARPRAPPPEAGDGRIATGSHPPCCPLYHEAIELIGRRWTGAIVSVLIHRTTLRFGEIADSVPELSDRLLSERMKELEARGVVVRTRAPGPARARRVRAHRDGPRARARRPRARALGAALARAALSARRAPRRAAKSCRKPA